MFILLFMTSYQFLWTWQDIMISDLASYDWISVHLDMTDKISWSVTWQAIYGYQSHCTWQDIMISDLASYDGISVHLDMTDKISWSVTWQVIYGYQSIWTWQTRYHDQWFFSWQAIYGYQSLWTWQDIMISDLFPGKLFMGISPFGHDKISWSVIFFWTCNPLTSVLLICEAVMISDLFS